MFVVVVPAGGACIAGALGRLVGSRITDTGVPFTACNALRCADIASPGFDCFFGVDPKYPYPAVIGI